MDDISKLHHLLEHWAEHNVEHSRTYMEWAKNADALGKKELARILKKIAEETTAIDSLFKKAMEACR
jgi:rubrerythrin